MSRALRAELIKLSTTRTFIALTASAAGLSLLIAVLVTSIDTQFSEEDVRSLFTGTDVTGLFVLLLGAIGMAGEWRHRTIASTVLAVPHRLLLLAAKVLGYAIAGAALALVVNFVVMAVGSAILSGRGEETLALGDLADILWRNLLIAAFFGAFGVCIGALIRNPAGAIVALLALSFIVEPLVLTLATDVGRFLPLSGLPAGLTEGAALDEETASDLLSPGVSALVMVAWVAALFAAAAATLRQRDLV